MTKLIIHPGAEDDALQAYQYYAKQDRQAAERFDMQVDAAIQRIADDPTGGTALDEQYRFYSLKNFPHLIMYRHAQDVVTVVAVYHPSREPSYWRNR